MGCSASRSLAFISKHQDDYPYPSNQSSSDSSDSSLIPVSRTLSLPTPLIHHPPLCKGDTNHLVSLTSTTYGSLLLLDPHPPFNSQHFPNNPSSSHRQLHGPSTHLSSSSSSSSYSVVNTWELMEDLDDLDFQLVTSPIHSPQTSIFRKESEDDEEEGLQMLKSYEFVDHKHTKPLWQHLSEESLLANMDPNVVSSYRRAMSSKRIAHNDPIPVLEKDEIVSPHSNYRNSETTSLLGKTEFYLPGRGGGSGGGGGGGDRDRILLYYTSLRGIRKTYEDCCEVRMIFRGFRVFVDERDISMDSSYRKELQEMLKGKAVSLPQVFIRGKHIGGADEIKQLHEAGDLANLLEGFPLKNLAVVCESCGDARFVPCLNCNGSRKVFEESQGKLGRCPQCNENGLIRCPSCCP